MANIANLGDVGRKFRLPMGRGCSILSAVLSAKVQSFGRELARNTLARAFAVSVLVHFVGISGVELGSRLGWWKMSVLPSGKSRAAEEMLKAERLLQEQIQQALQVPEAQLVFVEVDPAQAVEEAPKDTPFYSSQNTVAANPVPDEKERAKIEGQQDKIPKTFDTLKPAAPQPAPTPERKVEPKREQPEQKPEPQRPVPREETKPTREQKPGETLIARAAPRPQPETPPHQQQRPRTIAEAKVRKGIIEGQKSQQEGGVRRQMLDPGFDVRRTPFGSYDLEFIEAVQARWFSLLDQRGIVGTEPGKVVVVFRLNADGRISGLRVAETEVGDLLSWYCQAAILDPSPYRPFPSDLRRALEKDYREIRFTFYYSQ